MKNKWCRNMEKYLNYEQLSREAYETSLKNKNDAIANSIANTALLIGAKLIVCFTETGRTAYRISKARPCCPIVCVTNNRKTANFSALYWGLYAKHINVPMMPDFIEEMEVIAITAALQEGVPAGSPIIVAGGTPTGSGNTNFMRIINVPEIKDI